MPNINDKMKPYARALTYVTIHLSRDVHRGSIKKREGERAKFFNRTPTGPRKKSFILYIYIVYYFIQRCSENKYTHGECIEIKWTVSRRNVVFDQKSLAIYV